MATTPTQLPAQHIPTAAELETYYTAIKEIQDAFPYGYPYFYRELLASAQPSFDITGIPEDVRVLRVSLTGRADGATAFSSVGFRINNASTASYFYHAVQDYSTTITAPISSTGQTQALVGFIPAASTANGVGLHGGIELTIPGWNSPNSGSGENLPYLAQSSYWDSVANSILTHWAGMYYGAGPYNRLTVFPTSGSFVAGSQIHIEGLY